MSEFEVAFEFGGGLDRASGVAVASPARMRDLRNVYLYSGKVQARRGYARTDERGLVVPDGTPCDSVLALQEVRQEFSAIAVGHVAATGGVHVFRVSDVAANAEYLGQWFTARSGVTPRVIAAEMYGKVFLAHDEPKTSRRARTIYYDSAQTPVLAALRANLARITPEPAPLPEVKFRGVVAHSGYLWGWGYGTSAQEHAPATLRNSKPGEPSVFEPDSSGNFGSGGDAILCCGSAGGGLMVQKGSETHLLQGYSNETFSPRLIDARYGAVASRVGVQHGGAWYTWTAEGPRVSEGGGALVDLALPLDLGGPGVAALAAEGALADGFALYVPERRLVQWYFGRRVYTLSLYDPSAPAWSYVEIPAEANCGAVLAIPSAEAPSSAPRALAASGVGDTTAALNWSNDGDANGTADNDGDETIEVWLKASGGAWNNVFNTLAIGVNQSYAANGLSAGLAYEVAYRYRRGTRYTSGYEGSDPALWPAASRTTFTTTQSAPVVGGAGWSRVSATAEKVALSFTGLDASKATKVYRGGVEITQLAAGVSAYTDASVAGEMAYLYTVRQVNADATLGPESAAHRIWTGPAKPVWISTDSRSSSFYTFSFSPGVADAQTDHEDDSSGPAGSYVYVQTLGAGVVSGQGSAATGRSYVKLRLRHQVVAYGIADYSEYVNARADICTACGA